MCIRALFLLFLLFEIPAFGQSRSFEYQALPTVISGTLQPFALAIDGKKLPDIEKASQVIVNKMPIETRGENNKRFYIQTNEDELNLKFVSDDPSSDMVIRLPRIKTIQDLGTPTASVLVEFENTETLMVDDVKITVNKNQANWALPTDEAALKSIHVFELTSTEGWKRVYNVTIKIPDLVHEQVPEPKTSWTRIELGGGTVFNGSSPIGSLGFGFNSNSRLTWGFSMRYGTIGQISAAALQTSFGYQILRHENVPTLPSWLEAGLVVQATGRQLDAIGGGSDNPFLFNLQTGFYLRSEIIAVSFFGIGLRLEGAPSVITTVPGGTYLSPFSGWFDFNFHF